MHTDKYKYTLSADTLWAFYIQKPHEEDRVCYCTCESEISEGFSVRLLFSAGIRSLYFVLTSSSE